MAVELLNLSALHTFCSILITYLFINSGAAEVKLHFTFVRAVCWGGDRSKTPRRLRLKFVLKPLQHHFWFHWWSALRGAEMRSYRLALERGRSRGVQWIWSVALKHAAPTQPQMSSACFCIRCIDVCANTAMDESLPQFTLALCSFNRACCVPELNRCYDLLFKFLDTIYELSQHSWYFHQRPLIGPLCSLKCSQ